MLLIGVLLAALGTPPVSSAVVRQVQDLLRQDVERDHAPPVDPPSGRPVEPSHT
jgi:hypothetical protein